MVALVGAVAGGAGVGTGVCRRSCWCYQQLLVLASLLRLLLRPSMDVGCGRACGCCCWAAGVTLVTLAVGLVVVLEIGIVVAVVCLLPFLLLFYARARRHKIRENSHPQEKRQINFYSSSKNTKQRHRPLGEYIGPQASHTVNFANFIETRTCA